MDKTTGEKIKTLRQEGYGYKRIATDLDLPLNTVKSFVRRCQSSENEESIGNTCRQCGAPLFPSQLRKTKKFCSDKCRIAWWNANRTKLNKPSEKEYKCAFCGKTFRSYPSKKQKYCSRICFSLSLRKEQG